jgi:hypothetical protein
MDNVASTASMQTAGGGRVSLLDPRVGQIELSDIIIASSRIVRFNGHTPITLINHSCRVHDIVRDAYGITDPIVLRQALMHDAHEVYVTDVPSPLKAAMRMLSSGGGPSTYDVIEDRLAAVVAEKFDFPLPLPSIVKEADLLACAMEANQSWGPGTVEAWGGLPSPVGPFDPSNWFNDNDLAGRLMDTQARQLADAVVLL